MFTLLILIAAFSTGDIVAILCAIGFLAFVWFCIINEWTRYNTTTKIYKQNPIDKYGDEHYGTIDWLKDGKL